VEHLKFGVIENGRFSSTHPVTLGHVFLDRNTHARVKQFIVREMGMGFSKDTSKTAKKFKLSESSDFIPFYIECEIEFDSLGREI